MKFLIKLNPYYLVAYLCFSMISLISIFVGSKGDLILFFEINRSESWTLAFRIITFFGEAWAFLVAIVLLCFTSYKRALYIAVGGIVIIPVIQGLKSAFAHPRPIRYFELSGMPDLFSNLEGVDWLTGMNSFPSGHTAAAFVLFSLIGFTAKNKRLGMLWILPAIGAGFSRIYLRHHFLEDVLLGSLIGMITAYCTILVLNKPSAKWFNSDSILSRNKKVV